MAPTTTTTTAPGSAWALVWSDEFDGASVDAGRWRRYHNNYGSANNELQCNRPGNATVAGGVLTITGRVETVSCPNGGQMGYTSAFLGSRDVGRWYPLYGRYEIRAKVSHGQGLWPAFWLRHRNGSSVAEVDVLEVFHSQAPGQATQTLHFPTTLGSNVASKRTAVETPSVLGGWHRYAVDIEPAGAGAVRFTFSIDGVTTHSYTNTAASWLDSAPADATWDVAVNMAIGGKWVGRPDSQLGYLPDVDRCSLTGKAPAGGDPNVCPTTGLNLAQLPATYQVDWVRVYVPS